MKKIWSQYNHTFIHFSQFAEPVFLCSAAFFSTRNWIPIGFLFRGIVRNVIPRVCFYFCSTKRNSELFYLPRKSSKRNSERFLLWSVALNSGYDSEKMATTVKIYKRDWQINPNESIISTIINTLFVYINDSTWTFLNLKINILLKSMIKTNSEHKMPNLN